VYVDDSPINTSGTFNLSALADQQPAANRNIITQSVTSGEKLPEFSHS
jgi:hypothetical protein